MQVRKDPLVNDHYYHVFSRSIAKFKIFNSRTDFERITDLLYLCRYQEFNIKYSRMLILAGPIKESIRSGFKGTDTKTVDIVAYCIMPTHIHILIKQNSDKGISMFMSKVLNSYARYFNVKTDRVGPLWAGRFKSVIVADDDQMLHLTRYIHLNPVSAGLVDDPEDWDASSYHEYLKHIDSGICKFEDIIDMSAKEYRKFVNERKSYQRELSLIKSYLIDGYSG